MATVFRSRVDPLIGVALVVPPVSGVAVAVIGLLSLLSILSYNEFAQWRIGGNNLNDVLDFFSNQVLLPVGGLLIAVFAGWMISRDSSRAELGRHHQTRDELVAEGWPVLR